MHRLCTGVLIRHGLEGLDFVCEIQAPCDTALSVALWARLASRMAFQTAVHRQHPVHGVWALYDADHAVVAPGIQSITMTPPPTATSAVS